MKEYFSLIWEVESQSTVKRVAYSDEETDYGYEPQCTLVLKEPGRFYLNTLAATLHGEAALHQFNKGDLVAVKLRFEKKECNNEYLNRVTIEEIVLVKKLKKAWL